MVVDTPLRRWIKSHDYSIGGFARVLKISRGRAQFWVNGEAMPRGEMLDLVLRITGLKLRDLLPHPDQVRRRRMRTRALRGLPRVELRVRKPKPQPDLDLSQMVKGKHGRPAHNRRAS